MRIFQDFGEIKPGWKVLPRRDRAQEFLPQQQRLFAGRGAGAITGKRHAVPTKLQCSEIKERFPIDGHSE